MPVDDRPPVFADTTEIAEGIAEVVLGVTERANERIAPGTPLLLADETEADRVGKHSAKIIGRHMPAGMGAPGNPDLADAVAIGITVFRYLWRQVRLWGMLRQQRDDAGDEDQAAHEQPVPAGADPLG